MCSVSREIHRAFFIPLGKIIQYGASVVHVHIAIHY